MKTVIDPNSIFYHILEVVRLVYPGQLILDEFLKSSIILVSQYSIVLPGLI
jgi:hypothetical protein